MNRISVFMILILSVFSLGCKKPFEQGVHLTVRDKGENHTVFIASFPNKLTVNNIIYKKEKIGGKWLLQIKNNSGLKLVGSVANDQSKERYLSEDEYIQTLEAILNYLSSNQGYGDLSEIQLDLRLVNTVWVDVIDSIKKAAGSNEGVVTNKNKMVDKSVRDVLKNSRVILKTCKLVENFHRKCKLNFIAMNPIAFQRKHLNKSWKEVSNSSDAGVQQSMWFSIQIRNGVRFD